MDKKVKEYIEKQQAPQKDILKKVRDLILESLPNCDEKAAWGVVTFAGGKFYLYMVSKSGTVQAIELTDTQRPSSCSLAALL